MDIKERQQALFRCFKEHMEGSKWDVGDLSIKRDRATLTSADGTKISVHLATVKRGYGKGEFGVYFGLILSGGTIFEVMREAKVLNGCLFSDERILTLSSLDFKATGSSLYLFKGNVDIEKRVAKIVGDIRESVAPIEKMLAGNYTDMLDLAMSEPGYLTKPFCVCIVLLGLSDRLKDTEKLIKRVSRQEAFWDFHQATNPAKEIVMPISKVFAKRI